MTCEQERHICTVYVPAADCGSAFTACWEVDARVAAEYADYEEGQLWITNDEYASQVNYCPVCGFQARVQIEPDEMRPHDDLPSPLLRSAT